MTRPQAEASARRNHDSPTIPNSFFNSIDPKRTCAGGDDLLQFGTLDRAYLHAKQSSHRPLNYKYPLSVPAALHRT